jgi:ribosomal protein S18 acetylase RimI-like enzyme
MTAPPLPAGSVVRELPLADGRRLVIRHGVPDDAEAMLEFFRRTGGESDFVTFGAEGLPRTVEEERAVIARLTGAPNALSIVAVDGALIAGSMRFVPGDRPRTRHGGEFGIAVLRDYAGHGVGRALMECLVRWAEASGVVRKLDLRVRADNARAIRLYESFGFRVEGRISRDMLLPDGTFHDALWMGRPVDPPASPGAPSGTPS